MVLGKHKQKETINLTINGAEIRGQNSVTLLEVEIGNELCFKPLSANLTKLLTNCLSAFNHFVGLELKGLIIIHQIFVKKTGNKINAISRIQTLLSQKEKL